MMRRRTLPVALAACAWLAACSETTGPEVPGNPVQSVEQSVNDGGSQPHVLRQSAAAPQLQTYEMSVEACYGEPARLNIRYLANSDDDDQDGPNDFLSLFIPRSGLWKHPDGSAVGPGDCILITVSLDAEYLLAEFHPAGIEFNPESPAMLRMSYAQADRDLDGDDDVDDDDEELARSELDVWRLPHDDEQWQALRSLHFVSAKRFLTPLRSFSHYAVAH